MFKNIFFMARHMMVPVAKVTFRKDLHPPFEPNLWVVQQLAEDLEPSPLDLARLTKMDFNLPPIEVNQHNELIAGWHYLEAYKKTGRAEIPVIVTRTNGDTELKELAFSRGIFVV